MNKNIDVDVDVDGEVAEKNKMINHILIYFFFLFTHSRTLNCE